jgi:hypothetical protein
MKVYVAAGDRSVTAAGPPSERHACWKRSHPPATVPASERRGARPRGGPSARSARVGDPMSTSIGGVARLPVSAPTASRVPVAVAPASMRDAAPWLAVAASLSWSRSRGRAAVVPGRGDRREKQAEAEMTRTPTRAATKRIACVRHVSRRAYPTLEPDGVRPDVEDHPGTRPRGGRRRRWRPRKTRVPMVGRRAPSPDRPAVAAGADARGSRWARHSGVAVSSVASDPPPGHRVSVRGEPPACRLTVLCSRAGSSRLRRASSQVSSNGRPRAEHTAAERRDRPSASRRGSVAPRR